MDIIHATTKPFERSWKLRITADLDLCIDFVLIIALRNSLLNKGMTLNQLMTFQLSTTLV